MVRVRFAREDEIAIDYQTSCFEDGADVRCFPLQLGGARVRRDPGSRPLARCPDAVNGFDRAGPEKPQPGFYDLVHD